MAQLAAGLVGWHFIPSMLADQLVKFFHHILGSVPPPRASPEHRKQVKWAYSAVVFGYALFTFQCATASIERNYYELMGINPTADDSDLKAAFRVFAKKYHPDRAGAEGEVFFMHIRTVFEALKNPTTRFAYDRFGPDVLDWKNTTTISECIQKWLWNLIPTYVISIFVVLFWNAIVPRSLVFWNFILVFGTLALEILFVLSPSPHATFSSASSSIPLSAALFSNPVDQTYANIFTYIWPRRVAYQHILLIRQLSILLSSALQHLIPNLFPTSTPRDVTEEILTAYLKTLMKIVGGIDQEIVNTLQLSIHGAHGAPSNSTPSTADFSHITALQPEPPVKERLLKELQDMILENVMMSQGGPLKSACESAVVRKRRSEKGQMEFASAEQDAANTSITEATKQEETEKGEDRSRGTSGSSVGTAVGACPSDKENAPPARGAPGDILDQCIVSSSVSRSPLILPTNNLGAERRAGYVRARSHSLS
ncbi:hypothetical protein BDY19DRAFT_887465 [Irpex rosettiformis]|uniref:Uncharacterized protein n=1 Tax=Irpex rosettiformis TaxID=378272 RepID=A0ACB8U8P5_9APHY|nr:hypothetical protein BDY19DRAFT_887465 [Irpex rosettiformis]